MHEDNERDSYQSGHILNPLCMDTLRQTRVILNRWHELSFPYLFEVTGAFSVSCDNKENVSYVTAVESLIHDTESAHALSYNDNSFASVPLLQLPRSVIPQFQQGRVVTTDNVTAIDGAVITLLLLGDHDIPQSRFFLFLFPKRLRIVGQEHVRWLTETLSHISDIIL